MIQVGGGGLAVRQKSAGCNCLACREPDKGNSKGGKAVKKEPGFAKHLPKVMIFG